MTTAATRFERLGGEQALRPIVHRFVDRCFDDTMIGFLFRRADRDRVKRFEYQHAAEFLGAGVRYEGRALRAAHAAHRIMGGQFMRRLQILRETLEEHDVPEETVTAWLTHQESLRAHITAQPGSECID